mmetsp:Transcript_3257/g.6928  ORF Transcript_3257/g.6928 Transcript_3257/m.6928 type:complete len:96 (-) Transcript_3257:576-863(-)
MKGQKEATTEEPHKEQQPPKIWSVDVSLAKLEEWPSTQEGYASLGFYLSFVVVYIVIVTMQSDIGTQYLLGEGLSSTFNPVVEEDDEEVRQPLDA